MLESPIETDSVEIYEKVEIVSTDDEKIKLIGNLLSNDSSRTILKLLFEKEMTANELAQKTGMLVSLVIHHLQKMQEASIIKVNKIGKSSKGHNMKYYGTTKFAVIILPSKISEKAKKSKSLIRSLIKIYKFAAIGIAGAITWLALKPTETTVPLDKLLTPHEPSLISEQFYLSIALSLAVVIAGLIIERVIASRVR